MPLILYLGSAIIMAIVFNALLYRYGSRHLMGIPCFVLSLIWPVILITLGTISFSNLLSFIGKSIARRIDRGDLTNGNKN